ncbi:MAG: hypothetical protein GY932_04905 [Arcobacter sp.]|nr:hypothetical protein [Arcobacter sp.]
MRSLKFILLAAVFSLTVVSCVKTDLNEDETMLNNSDVVYATGGQVDEEKGLD